MYFMNKIKINLYFKICYSSFQRLRSLYQRVPDYLTKFIPATKNLNLIRNNTVNKMKL